MKKYCADQYHPTADAFLPIFEFSDFEAQRMNLCLKKSRLENFQFVLVPAILEEQDDVFIIICVFTKWKQWILTVNRVIFRLTPELIFNKFGIYAENEFL
jgi:hypothetical protein